MDADQWTPAMGWRKAAVWIGLWGVIGIALQVGVLFGLACLLDSLGATTSHWSWPVLGGIIIGFVAGKGMVYKTIERSGLSGRSLLGLTYLFIVLMAVGGYQITGLFWPEQLTRLWLCGMASAMAMIFAAKTLLSEG